MAFLRFPLDPRTKLLASAMLIGACVLIETLDALLIVSGALLLIMRFSSTPLKLYGRRLLMISWLLVATFLTHVWGYPGFDGVFAGGIAVGRLGLMLGWVTLLNSSSTPLELVNGLERLCVPLRRVGVPVHDVSFVAMLSMRFLPLLVEEGQSLFQACLARGIEWDQGSLRVRLKNVGVFFLPLFSHLYRRVEHLTLAMENRAFQLDEERTSLYIFDMGLRDYVALSGCVLALVVGYRG